MSFFTDAIKMDSCGQFKLVAFSHTHAGLSNAPDLEIDVKICAQNQFRDLRKLQFQLYPASQEFMSISISVLKYN